jgi:hypothetical protein
MRGLLVLLLLTASVRLPAEEIGNGALAGSTAAKKNVWPAFAIAAAVAAAIGVAIYFAAKHKSDHGTTAH